MEKILKKLIMKYFVFKLQEDWREDLKKIPEERLKKWMDEELFVKMTEQVEALSQGFIDEACTTWDNEVWMDINDFVTEYNEELEKIIEDQDVPEEYWDTEDGDAEDESKEVVLMHCIDANPECNCDHQDIHPHNIGCDTGCVYQAHNSCIVYAEEQTELSGDVPENTEFFRSKMSENIMATGGL